MQKRIPENIIEGSLVMIGLAEAVHLAALFLKLPLNICAKIMAVLFLGAALFAAVRLVIARKKGKHKKAEGEGGRLLKLMRVYPWLFAGIGILILIQIVWNFYSHVPYLTGDITGETVQTMLATDSIYTINPMTGQAYTAGMPLRLQILVLPTLYAAICQLTGISVPVLLYSVVPSLVLLLSYLVYTGWAVYLFPREGKKQLIFMLFVVIIYQFGCYSAAMDSFLVFFQGWQGTAVRAGVILPYALLCCLQGKWRSVILCLLAEVCVVWTLYGLGYTVIMVLVLGGIRLVRFLFSRKMSTKGGVVK